MSEQSQADFVSALKALSRAASVMVMIIGGLVLIGWALDVAILKSGLPGLTPMRPNTALAFILAGLSLWPLGAAEAPNRVRWFGLGCGFLVALIGLLTLCEYALDWTPGIDRWLLANLSGTGAVVHPARMAPVTALNLLTLGLALQFVHLRRCLWAAQLLSLLAGVVALLVLIGYAYGVKSFYGANLYSQMGLHTASAFAVLCMGILLARPEQGLMAPVTSQSAGGLMARRLWPAALAIPAVVGWLRLLGEQFGIYQMEFGVSLSVMSSMVLFTILIWWTAGQLNRLDAQRQQTERAVRGSEEKFRALASTANDGIILADSRGKILFFNPGAEAIFGYSATEVSGKPLTVLMPERFHEPHQRGLERFLTTGKAHIIGRTVEFAGRKKDGSQFPLELSLATWQTGEGIFFTAILRDITQRKQAEQKLAQVEERFQSLLESVRDYGIFMLDPQGHIMTWNAGAQAIKGYTADEVRGRHLSLFYTPEDVQAHRPEKLLQRAEAEGRVEDEGWRVRKDGSRFWADVVLSVVRDESGKLIGFSKVTRDLTHRKLSEAKIQTLNQDLNRRAVELQAVNKELQTFAYSVSHDLRSPLRAIDGFTKCLLEESAAKLDERSKSDLLRVRAASQRMDQLIDDLLALSQVTRREMNRARVDLSSLAEGILTELQKNEPQRQVEIVVAANLAVDADPNLLRILLDNLLGNAWKFTGQKPQARIEVGVISHEGQPAYFVRDNGAGFDMAYAGKLFGAFQRLHRATEFEGTGIGLATVQRIVHRHGGRVWAESAVGKGATFYFTLA